LLCSHGFRLASISPLDLHLALLVVKHIVLDVALLLYDSLR